MSTPKNQSSSDGCMDGGRYIAKMDKCCLLYTSLFESSIINLKEDGFRKKYIFKFDDGAALSEELQHNIDEGIYESLKDI